MAETLPSSEDMGPPAKTLTLLLWRARDGEREATNALAQNFYQADGYFDRLVRWMKGDVGSETHAEDAVQSAIGSFCLRLEKGEFPDLPNRDHLWKILVTIARRKAANAVRSEGVKKRERSRTQSLSDQDDGEGASASATEDPARYVEEKEFLEWLLATLPNRLRQVAVMKLDNCNESEIAQAVDVSRTTVWRDLETIRVTSQ